MTNAFTITDQIIITTDGTVVVLKEDGTKLFGAKPPIFSFEYKALSFMQSQQMYLTTEGVDAQLNDDQQLEICNYLKTTEENAALSAALQSS